MSHEISYCPYCGEELEFQSYEHLTCHRVYKPCGCRVYKKQCGTEQIKMDSEGFCLDPLRLRGRYLIKRPS